MSIQFYVYTLSDPRTGTVFYVGKGQGRRAWMHEQLAKRGKGSNAEKTARILQILEAGNSVEVNIVSTYSDEGEAYKAEVELIADIGIENLTNANCGGGGAFSGRESPASELRTAVSGLELLLSMGDEAEWIAQRNYSQEQGKLWYSRLTNLLKLIIRKIIDRQGADRFKEFAFNHFKNHNKKALQCLAS